MDAELTPSPRRCVAANRAGEQCGRAPIRGGDVCDRHGGKAPQTVAAAKRRLLEAVEPAITRLLRFIEAPPGLCDVCGRCDDTSAIVSAIRTLLDRGGLHPSLTVQHAAPPEPSPWIEFLTEPELEQVRVLIETAQQRMESGVRVSSPLLLAEGVLVDEGVVIDEEPEPEPVRLNPFGGVTSEGDK